MTRRKAGVLEKREHWLALFSWGDLGAEAGPVSRA